jgi:hypothetical protein
MHSTAFGEALRTGGLDALRQAMGTSMEAACQAIKSGPYHESMCQTAKHKEQMCAEWFVRQGPCSDSLVDFSARNRQLCSAALSIATDYPEIQTRR